MNYLHQVRMHGKPVGAVAGVEIYTSYYLSDPQHVTVIWGTRTAQGYIGGPKSTFGQLEDSLAKMSKKRRDAVLAYLAMKGFTA